MLYLNAVAKNYSNGWNNNDVRLVRSAKTLERLIRAHCSGLFRKEVGEMGFSGVGVWVSWQNKHDMDWFFNLAYSHLLLAGRSVVSMVAFVPDGFKEGVDAVISRNYIIG